jgi:hypothetical protein
VQGHFLASAELKLATNVFGHEHLVLECPDLQARLFIQDAIKRTNDLGDHKALGLCST